MRYPVVVVNAIILDGDGRVLLTRRRDNLQWCLPGGYVEYGETLAEAVCREVQEEIGIQVKVDRCTGLYSEPNLRIIPPAQVHLIVIAFRCSCIGGHPGPTDEVAEATYFDTTQLPPMIETHPARIKDALIETCQVRVT